MRKGILENYDGLFLPASHCISDGEARRLKGFVERGRLLIGDIRPGIADEHGRVGAQKIIPSLFGIRGDNAVKPIQKRRLLLSGNYRGTKFSAPSHITLPIDPALVLDGAEASLKVDRIPLVLCNAVGEGTAVLLNFPFPEGKALAENLRNILSVILKVEAIQPPVKIEKFYNEFSEGDWVPVLNSRASEMVLPSTSVSHGDDSSKTPTRRPPVSPSTSRNLATSMMCSKRDTSERKYSA